MKQLLFFLLLPLTTHTQSDSRHLTVGLYNFGLGALTGGIGSMIHKAKGTKHWDAFKQGALKGSVGATVSYMGKHVVRTQKVNGKNHQLWIPKLIHSIGNSMTHNASQHKGLFDSYYLHIGMNRFEFHFKNEFRFSYKIMPIATLGFLEMWRRHGSPDWKHSLQLLTPVFTSKRSWDDHRAYELQNSIFAVKRNGFISFLYHEIIHSFQHIDFLPVNNYYQFFRKKEKPVWFVKLNKLTYWDLNSVMLNQTFYKIENINKQRHSDNFLEYEAFYFSDRNY